MDCSMDAHCFNKEGKEVRSKLFSDLIEAAEGNRSIAKDSYSIARSKNFLSKFKDKLSYDENGEVTLHSLIKYGKIKLSDAKKLNRLNKEFNSEEYSFNESLQRTREFNQNNPDNVDYLAVMTDIGDGKYKTEIVRNNYQNKKHYKETISNQAIQNRIINALHSAGADVSFIENSTFNGRYSTVYAEKTAEGLYNVIQLSKSLDNITPTLAEEAGHFSIGALGEDHPLVKRLENLLSKDVINKLISEDSDNKYMSDNPVREAMGKAVGNAILNITNKEQMNPVRRLGVRIWNAAKNIFNRLGNRDFHKEVMAVKSVADQIADNFLSGDFEGNVERALNTKETLYDADKSSDVKAFIDVLNKITPLALNLKKIDAELSHKIEDIRDGAVIDYDVSTPGSISNLNACLGMSRVLQDLSSIYSEYIAPIMKSVEFSDNLDFNEVSYKYSEALYTTREFIDTSSSILDIIDNSLDHAEVYSQYTGIEYNTGDKKHHIDLREAINTMKTGIGELCTILESKERNFSIAYLSKILGKDFVQRRKRFVLRKNSKGRHEWMIDEGRKIPITDILDNLDNDINIVEQNLLSTGNNSDLIAQMLDKKVKEHNHRAELNTLMTQSKLLALKDFAEKSGIKNYDFLYEYSVDESGNKVLTGNFLTEYNMDEYDKAFQSFRMEKFNEFLELYPETKQYPKRTTIRIFKEWANDSIKKWKEDNTVEEPDGSIHPSVKYYNLEYYKFIKDTSEEGMKKVEFYNKIMELKNSIYEAYDDYMPLHRMPQFKGRFINRIKNKSESFKTSKTICKTIRENFVLDSNDSEFGTRLSDNMVIDPLNEESLYRESTIRKVLQYGVNKIEDKNDLSTDIFHSLLAFSSMANSYNEMSKIATDSEILLQSLKKRSVNNVPERRLKNGSSKAFSYLREYVDKHIYREGNNPIMYGNVSVAKTLGTANRLASAMFLGGNVAGATVNMFTGEIEVLKEALVGEYFSINDYRKALSSYASCIASNWMAVGKDYKQDKVSLIAKRFNFFGRNIFETRDWQTQKGRLNRFSGKLMRLPYEIGDNHMQAIAYLALLHKNKVVDGDGVEMSLYDAYKDSIIEDEESNETRYKQLSLGEQYYHSKYGMIIATSFSKILSSIQNKTDYNNKEVNNGSINLVDIIDDCINKEIIDGDYRDTLLSFINDQCNDDIIATNNIVYYKSSQDLKNKLIILDNKLKQYRYTIEDESILMDKARELNNRMHGIYNFQDFTKLHNNAITKSLLTMKGYILGMAARKWITSRYNISTNNEYEGNMITNIKVLGAALSGFFDTNDTREGTSQKIIGRLISLGNGMSAMLVPFLAHKTTVGNKLGKHQLNNLKRTWYDFAVIGVLCVLKGIFSGIAYEDDRERKARKKKLKKSIDRLKKHNDFTYINKLETTLDNKSDTELAYGLLHYISTRLMSEQGAFNMPLYMNREYENLTNIIPVGAAATYLIGSTIYDLVDGYLDKSKGEDLRQKYNKTPKDGETNYYREGQDKLNKGTRKVIQNTPYVRLLPLLEDTKKSSNYFDYGRAH